MDEGVSNLGTLSNIRRSSSYTDLQGIRADYYNLTDVKGAPLAGMLVLMDRCGRPVRAEVHMNDTDPDSLYEIALRQANHLITDRYRSDRSIRLYPLLVRLDHDPLALELKAPTQDTRRVPRWFFSMVGGVLVLFLALGGGWFLNEWLTGNADSNPLPARVLVDSSNSQISFETNGLPPSRNAIPMEVGNRVRFLSGYSTPIRTEPGVGAGEIAGDLQNVDSMTLINGPVWLPGNSDTIVWWYVQLDDGTEGWVPANTSELTLLEPAP